MGLRALSSVLLIGILLCACKKDQIDDPVPTDFSHLSGNFLCEVGIHRYYTDSYHDYSDRVVNVSVNGNILTFQGLNFPIESESQTVFEYSDLYGSATLTFTNGYDSIQMSYHQPSVSSGPSYTDNYSGSRTSLPVTTSPHSSASSIEGQYQMNILKRNTLNGLDTSYSEIILVSIDPTTNNFSFGVDSFDPGFFHSYSNQTDNIGQLNYYTDRSLLWRNDSLYILQEDIDFNTNDTVSFSYIGNHL